MSQCKWKRNEYYKDLGMKMKYAYFAFTGMYLYAYNLVPIIDNKNTIFSSPST